MCQLWVNEQGQGVIVFPSTVSFIDNSSLPIMIPPPNPGSRALSGTLKQLLIALNATTIYPTGISSYQTAHFNNILAAMGDCLWRWGASCYKFNLNYSNHVTCPAGTYKDSVSNVRASCPLGCSQCSNGSFSSCTACAYGHTYDNGTCQCSPGTYFNFLTAACSKLILNFRIFYWHI